ncbi:MAG: NfeD family protein [Bacteroidia bacterium]|nr:NfeD family protein [Bacteroidia bacterium]
MNRNHRMCSVLLMVIFMITIILAGCKSGGNKAPKEDLTVEVPKDNATVYEDIKQAEKIFNALPSPLESAMLIKSAGARFDESLLNNVGSVNKYVTNKSMALNLGIYTCDLSFASLYEQTQLIIDYMNAAKKMADGLGILKAIEQSTIDRLEENINNSEVIMEIVSETFMNSNSYLEDNGQPAIAAMTLVGGWFEGLYISTQLVDMKEFNGNKLVGRIIDQKLSIDILISLLESSKGDPAVDELIGKKEVVTETIQPHKRGVVEMNGEKWNAECSENIEKNEMVEILAIEGTHLIVKKVEVNKEK